MDSADSTRCSYPCGACSRDIEDGERSILCEGSCAAWFHCDCALGIRLTAGQFSNLQTQKSRGFAPTAAVILLCMLSSHRCVSLLFPEKYSYTKANGQFYHRLLWTYLFGIWSASKGILCAFIWNELVAHRGANDVVSCLIFNTALGRTGAKWSIWWADKIRIILFFQDLMRRNVFSRIDYKFLVVGHTHGPMDRCFGAIER